MKPICPHCGRPMTLAKSTLTKSTADNDALTNFRSYRCRPCGCVFSEVVAVYDLAERAMMLDVEAGALSGAVH